MIKRFLKRSAWLVFAALVLAAVVLPSDVYRPNPAQLAAAGYEYSLLEWEAANFFSKWVHRVAQAMPWNGASREERLAQVDEYFRLGQEINGLLRELEQAAAQEGTAGSGRPPDIEARLDELRSRRSRLRNDVEEVLESAISAVVADIGFSSVGGFIFPPVDLRLSAPPKVLVTSPRDRIERTHDVLLDPGVSIAVSETLELELLVTENLAGLVVDIGGIATYPATILNNQPLQWTLGIGAHEWLHHFFVFRPLGWNMPNSPEMTTLNETAADIIGQEIGDRAFRLLGGDPIPREPRADESGDPSPVDPDRFDFDREMSETRLEADRLLADGRIDEAEAYMEERRKLFVENGHNIRKINQAFFAFNGTYADSPASVSPIGDQLHRLRELTPDLGTFIRTISGASSYEEFLEILDAFVAEGA